MTKTIIASKLLIGDLIIITHDTLTVTDLADRDGRIVAISPVTGAEYTFAPGMRVHFVNTHTLEYAQRQNDRAYADFEHAYDYAHSPNDLSWRGATPRYDVPALWDAYMIAHAALATITGQY